MPCASLRLRAPRRGGIVLLMAASLILLLGVMAIVTEGGLLMDQRRRAQSVADSAAMAAAVDLFENYGKHDGKDPDGTAEESARNTAAKLGYPHDGDRTKVTVNIPPKFGPHKDLDGYAEVLVEYAQPRSFSRVFGAGDMVVKARAVARGRWAAFKAGILVLDLKESEALKANGGGAVSVANADIIVNSQDDQATGSDGQGAVLRVTNGRFKLTGGVKSNTTLDGPADYDQKPTPDPLAHLPLPPEPTTTIQVKQTTPTSAEAKGYLDKLNIMPKNVGKMYVLEPGRYDSLPNFTSSDVVILKQASTNDAGGVYYLNDSGFTSTGATIVMDPTGATTGGLMLYNDPTKSSSGINITGGKVVIDPLATGKYAGISIFQNRDADVAINITGQGGMSFYGTFYAAKAPIKITGSSSSALDVIGSQYISRTLQTGGSGAYKVDWSPQKTARIREIGIVE
jgi:hypothetical protein